jgi:hypothetical protein
MPYRFRLRWRVEHGRTLKDLTERVEFDLAAGIERCGLAVVEEKSAYGGQGYSIQSGDFATPDEAHAAGERAQNALLLTSLRRGYGISLRPRTPGGFITEYGKHFLSGGQYDTVYDDAYGLTVFEAVGRFAFAKAPEAIALISEGVTGLIEALRAAATPPPASDPRTLVSYDLFANSRFENSARARFLLLVMSIESLVAQDERTTPELTAVEAAIQAVNSATIPGLLPDQRQALVNGISGLRRVSINFAVQAYLRAACAAGIVSAGDSPTTFGRSYGIRSKIVHRGMTPEASELGNLSSALEVVAKELLTAILEGRWK